MKRFTTIVIVFISLCVYYQVSIAQWKLDGMRVCPENSDQDNVAVATNEIGETAVAWRDVRYTEETVYFQHLTRGGNYLLPDSGVKICEVNSPKSEIHCYSLFGGESIIIWVDERNKNKDIFGQRIDQSGALMWGPLGKSICSAPGDQQQISVLVLDPSTIVIAWTDGRNLQASGTDIFAQVINESGDPAFAVNGVPVCIERGHQAMPVLAAGNPSEFIIAWADLRNGGVNSDIYSQKFDPQGTPLWNIRGNPVCTDPATQVFPRIVSSGNGATIITWEDSRNNGSVFGQRLDNQGNRTWTVSGVPVGGKNGFLRNHRTITDQQGGSIVVYEDWSGANADIYAQRIDPTGALLWGSGKGKPVAAGQGNQTNPVVVGDSLKGAIVVWTDTRDSANRAEDIYCQRLNPAGQALWAAGGVPVVRAKHSQLDHVAVADGFHGAAIGWVDMRSGKHVYIQKVKRNGEPLPVELVSFSVRAIKSTVYLDWITATETGNLGFAVERKKPRQAWSNVGFIKGQGTTNQSARYTFVDKEVPTGQWVYRLRQIDTDGKESILGERTITILTAPGRVALLGEYPNPITRERENLTVTFSVGTEKEVPVSIRIVDMRGETVDLLADDVFTQGEHLVTWRARSIPPGGYFIYLRSPAGSEVRKLLVQP
ncbi:MAG: T9SS type A sorting domain-containing protein [Chlorobi bacterium]|nr:T9SS type A sorting domain-containing protein [Chlorobiota bacterium]